jgi:DNA-binding LacI/PurR family transcriptional regulator
MEPRRPRKSDPPATASGARAVGMTDVARLAGVSHQTVSRVLNDLPNVRSTTRLRVQAAIRELGYRPNRAARTLKTGDDRTGEAPTIGIVVQATFLFGPMRLRVALESAAAEAGFNVSTLSVRDLARASVANAIDRHLDQQVQAIVVIGSVPAAQEAVNDFRVDVPVVWIEGGCMSAS